MNVKVTIIIPCYNMEKWIEEAIDSSLRQKNVDVEVIVIDDGSSDKSLEIIESFGEQIIYKTGPNQGVDASRNKGLELATGKYIVFLDADDKLEENSIYKQVELLEKTSSDICIGHWKKLEIFENNHTEISVPIVDQFLDENDLLLSLLSGWWGPPSAYMYNRQFLQSKNCKWAVGFGHPSDFEYIIKVVLNGVKTCHFPGTTGYYRHHGGNRISTSFDRYKVLQNLLSVLNKIEESKRMEDESLKFALCDFYFSVARNVYDYNRIQSKQILEKIYRLEPLFQPTKKLYSFLYKLIGFESLENIIRFKRVLVRTLSCRKN